MKNDAGASKDGQRLGSWAAVNIGAILVLLAAVGALPFWLPLDEAAGLTLLTVSGLAALCSAGWLLRGLMRQ